MHDALLKVRFDSPLFSNNGNPFYPYYCCYSYGLINIIFSLSLVLPNGDISLATLAIGDADSNGTVGNCEETIQTDS